MTMTLRMITFTDDDDIHCTVCTPRYSYGIVIIDVFCVRSVSKYVIVVLGSTRFERCRWSKGRPRKTGLS